MNMFVLVIILLSSNGNQLDTAEFYSKDACISAGVEWSALVDAIGRGNNGSRFICVPK